MNNVLKMHFWSEEISSPMRLAQTQRNGDTNEPPNPLPNVQLTPLPPNQPTILIRPPSLLLLMSLESCQQRDVYQSGLTTFAATSPIFCLEYFSEYFLSFPSNLFGHCSVREIFMLLQAKRRRQCLQAWLKVPQGIEIIWKSNNSFRQIIKV